MSRLGKAWRTWQIGIVGLVGCLGCQVDKCSLPKDPLFVSRRPIEAKPKLAPPVAVVFAEPIMPVDPAMALVKRNSAKNVPGVLTVNPGQDNRSPAGPMLMPPPN